MSVSPSTAIDGTGGESDGTEPLYFDSARHGLFGWLHRPTGRERADVGLLICKPFGYEAVCSHRGVRAFAEAAARIGVPALRFDYAGTGDSCELDESANRIDIWVDDVVAAVGELRRTCGVARVVILGMRLGALLACLAAGRATAVAGLVLIAPVTSGRRYLKELRTTRLAASIGEAQAAAPRSTSAPLEVSGFALSAATVQALAPIEIKAEALSRDVELLVIDGLQMPSAQGWAEGAARLGLHVRYETLPGLVQMLMTAPQFASIPDAMIAATASWLRELPRARDGETVLPISRDPTREEAVLRLLPAHSDEGSEITERALRFGAEELLFGILSEPGAGEVRRRGVILVNAGGDYHIGASGLYVSLARRWARRGYLVLRMDLAGLGDSGTRTGQRDNDIFPRHAVDDIREAIGWMRTHHGITDVTVGGVCSGAYHALRAAAESLPVNRILMVNPETFFWNETQSIYDMQTAELVRDPRAFRGKMLSLSVWKRLVDGRVDVGYVARILARRLLLALESHLHAAARRLRLRLRGDLGWLLEDVAARGVKIVLVFARGEPGLALLRIQAGSSLKRLGGRLKLHVIDGADHVFSRLESRSVLENTLSEELYTRLEWPASGATPIRERAAPGV